ncbi:TadE/TadG family type IV pilus assembly protein [Halopseudomonas bauzanensis]|uniref:Pilus assembly protein n=1 Tax=Halopseudomonas bauzanensis TaxID=653930 RepID=A0A4U0YS76_9GAMM|nr:TadE/TadG family type IV pilus assembly protein [Halopseudomonas bauzanensis]TKA92764.1 pilus assembly protein [Halopseudomonas bauzanensis]
MRSPVFRRKQHGAVAIEFAVLFSVFFAVLYAIIAYSMPLLLMLTFRQVAADAARATIAVDPAAGNYEINLENRVNTIIDESWISNTGWYTNCPSESGTGYSHLAANGRTLTVCIRYKNDNYNNDPIVPVLHLPGIGQIPRLPELIEGRSTIRL